MPETKTITLSLPALLAKLGITEKFEEFSLAGDTLFGFPPLKEPCKECGQDVWRKGSKKCKPILSINDQFPDECKRRRVLVGCEFSGVVREAFKKRGWDAWSCDFLPTEIPGQHIQGDVLDHLRDGWDLAIFHPPCTRLAVSGARWFKGKEKEQEEAVRFFLALAEAPIPHICIENPISIMSSRFRKPDQIIQPWQFGHGETKATCLWLKSLPQLKPTNIVAGREGRVWKEPPNDERWKNRSRTYQGIADAMAEQWSKPLLATIKGIKLVERCECGDSKEEHPDVCGGEANRCRKVIHGKICPCTGYKPVQMVEITVEA